MRLRVRSRSGVNTLTVDDNITVAQLYNQLSVSSISCGFPPRPLNVPSTNVAISTVLRDGDVIIAQPSSSAPASSADRGALPANGPATTATSKTLLPSESRVLKSATTAPSATVDVNAGAGTSANVIEDSTSIASNGTMLMREVPDDNSCLFRCVGAVSGLGRESAGELRKVISDAILTRAHEFPAGMLEREPVDYAAWVQSDHAWGGPIELKIFSDHFQMQIAAFDVITMRLDTYGPEYENVAYLIFNGIHYNYCGLSIAGLPEDITQFAVSDRLVLTKVKAIAQNLHDHKQFTNTNTFSLRCVQCGTFLNGANDANTHARRTGHSQFDEVNK